MTLFFLLEFFEHSDDVILTSQEFAEKDANEQEIPWGFGN